jgi:hypothetical protein
MASPCLLPPQSTYIYRVQSTVSGSPTPPPSLHSECVLPPHQRRGVNTRRAVRGCRGVNISEDAGHWIGLLQYNPSTTTTLKSKAETTNGRKVRNTYIVFWLVAIDSKSVRMVWLTIAK